MTHAELIAYARAMAYRLHARVSTRAASLLLTTLADALEDGPDEGRQGSMVPAPDPGDPYITTAGSGPPKPWYEITYSPLDGHASEGFTLYA